MNSDSPTEAVWQAIATRIVAAVEPAHAPGDRPILQTPRFYLGQVEGTPEPGYFLFGAGPEDEAGFYNGQPGVTGTWTIHCWGKSILDANRLYRWLKAALVGLDVTGFEMTDLVITKGRESPDDLSSAWQVPCYLSAEALQRVP